MTGKQQCSRLYFSFPFLSFRSLLYFTFTHRISAKVHVPFLPFRNNSMLILSFHVHERRMGKRGLFLI